MSLQKHSILIFHNNPILYESVQVTLESQGYCTVVVSNQLQLALVADKGVGDAIIIDGQTAGMPVEGMLQLVVGKYPYMPVLVLVAEGEIEEADGCIRNGAFDVVAKPVDSNRLISSICKAFQYGDLLRQNRKLEHYLLGGALNHPELFENIITKNHKMLGIFKIVETIGMSTNPVFITGEAGVGKKLIARTIHMVSQQEGAFIDLSDATFDENDFNKLLNWARRETRIVEHSARDGLLYESQVKTVYLGNISKLNEMTQVTLLKFMNTQEYCRVNPYEFTQAKFRIISASDKTIEEIFEEGQLTQELFHRLTTHHIHIPPLRERREDIPLLTERFIKDVAAVLNITPQKTTQEAMTMLLNRDYQANILELKKMVSEAVTSNSTGHISVMDFNDI
jgi:DNA-binding NtrC family response regulator